MRFSKEYSKLKYPIFTTIRQNKGYYKPGKTIKVITPKQEFLAEVVSVRPIRKVHITETIAKRDADCSKEELVKLMDLFYKHESNNLILITLMKRYYEKV